jgi:hypothetical protein
VRKRENIYSRRGHEEALRVRLRQVRGSSHSLIPADAIWALVERRNGDYEADAILARDCSSVMEF